MFDTDIFVNANKYLVDLIYLYIDEISFALIATLLVTFGGTINSFVKKKVVSWPFLGRIAIFICLCTFGYGLLTVLLQPLIKLMILNLGSQYLFFTTLLFFVILGLIAEKKKFI